MPPAKSSLSTVPFQAIAQRLFRVSPAQRAKFSLLRTLVRRDLEARYKGSVLGNLWPLLNQLSQLLIYTYVFSVVLQVKLDESFTANTAMGKDATFGMWLFAGLVPWIAFSNGLAQASQAVVSQANLVKKVVFPLALLPLVPVLSAFIESAIGMAILIVAVAFSSGTLQPTLALFPLVWTTQLLFTAGLAYLTAGLTVFLRDIPQTLGVILNLWMYATPIIYPVQKVLELLPVVWHPWIFWLNPMTVIVEIYRELVLVGSISLWGEWGIASAISLTVFGIGYWSYQRLRYAFADVL